MWFSTADEKMPEPVQPPIGADWRKSALYRLSVGSTRISNLRAMSFKHLIIINTTLLGSCLIRWLVKNFDTPFLIDSHMAAMLLMTRPLMRSSTSQEKPRPRLRCGHRTCRKRGEGVP